MRGSAIGEVESRLEDTEREGMLGSVSFLGIFGRERGRLDSCDFR